MANAIKILAVIPARGGSKRLPGKNIRPLCGKPLIAWTIEAARQCALISDIVVSTDSPQIAEVSQKYGVPVPWLRPEALATDTASSVDVLLHAIDEQAKKGLSYHYVALLEPTSPLRDQNDLREIIETAIKQPEIDGVITLGKVHMEHPAITKTVTTDGFIAPYIQQAAASRRRQPDDAFFPYGVCYLIKTAALQKDRAIYTNKIKPYFIARWQNYEVDDICDFYCIQAILEARLQGKI